MTFVFRTILLIAATPLISLCSAHAGRLISPWTKVRTPASGTAESIGPYSAGCLRGGTALPPDGPGFQAVRVKRNRHYGHPALVSFIRELGVDLKSRGEPAVLVGDMAMPRGGPTLSAHASHQTGLDADLWYWRPGKKLSRADRERLSARRVVDPKKLAVIPGTFGAREIALLKNVAERPAVDRVLVNYAVKRELCDQLPGETWIRKIRPWFGHDYHFHVRLKCAPIDTQCAGMAEIPAGNGCDASLAWWWSDEAQKKPVASDGDKGPRMPNLPAACEPVLAHR